MNEKKPTIQEKEHNIWPHRYIDLLKDFLSAPESLEKCIKQYFSDSTKKRFSNIQKKIKSQNFSKILFIGNTFNYFASFIPRHVFMNTKKDFYFSWECYELSEFYDFFMPKKIENTLFIFISNSGKSRFLIKCFEYLKLLEFNPNQIWLVTNEVDSPVRKNCGEIFQTFVDSEIVLGLKSFQNTVVVLYLLSQLLLENDLFTESIQSNFMNLVEEMRSYRKNWEIHSDKILKFLDFDLEFVYFIARDPASLSCAKLSALRSKTYHRQFAEGISLGLFFHGPFQIFERKGEKKSSCILLFGDKKLEKENINKCENTGEEMIGSKYMLIRLVNLIKNRAGKIIILSNNKSLHNLFKNNNQNILIVDFHSEIQELSPIFENYIISLVFLKMAKRDGLIK